MMQAPGARLGPYEIVSPLGYGGMGEVYRAHDTRLNRDVAIKILSDVFAHDLDRVARFTREAQTLAALNHPHIAQIYGVVEEPQNGTHVHALVMELVEGEDLSSVVAQGPIPIADALPIARQIADALDAAHEQGIVHRDLKPANIKVRADGTVKVLDFGLAKAAAPDGVAATADAMNSPTLTARGTQMGLILGTAAYMSPEQARGKAVDRRADIWAFGVVLYEMLTGRRLFEGEDASDVLAAVLRQEVDWSALPRDTPAGVRRVLRRSLEKDPRRRLRDIVDARADLEPAVADDRSSLPATRRRAVGPLAIALGLALAGWLATAVVLRRPAAELPALARHAMSFEIDGGDPQSVTISADGMTLAGVAPGADGKRRVWIRTLDSVASRELPGTDGASNPFLAPDGRSLGFNAGGQLKRLDVASGTVQVLADTPGVTQGGTWNAEGVIVFSNRFSIQAIAAGGGSVREVARLDRSRQENSLRWPSFLPDGRHFLYVARSGRPSQNAVYLGSLDGPPRRLFNTLSKVVFAAPGHVLFLRGSNLMATPFDPDRLSLGTDAVPVATGVISATLGVRGAFAVSESGVLVYSRGGGREAVSLQWFDRTGRASGSLSEPGLYSQFRIAPDGRRVAVGLDDEEAGNRSVWILEAGRTPVRFTFADTHDWEPAWSPDGTRIAFGSYRDGPLNLYVKSASGSGNDEPLLLSRNQKDVGDWSPDGRFFAYRDTQRSVNGDVAVSELSGSKRQLTIAATDAEERSPRFSGDGRWIAYVSDESGQPDVYVQPFPPTGAKWQVSVGGGDEPAWRGDGGELYFLDRQGVLTAVPVNARGASFDAGAPRVLFRAGASQASGGRQRYDAARDGMRFLVAVPAAMPPPQTIVVLNWPALLKTGGR